ncbi:hypothetical protein ACNPNP_04330 [Microbacterium sp. AGC85]
MYEEDSANAEQTADFATSLRAAIDARGVTLTWLRERLTDSGNPVSAATLSYWRSGARRPEGPQSLAAVDEIESLLQLDAGALRRIVGPSQRVGPIGAPQYPLESARLESATAETFIALGAPVMDPGRDVSTTAVTEVGADGFVISRTTRTLLQCTAGTITDVPYLDLTPGVRTPAPIFSAVSGGRISRTHSHPSGEVHGAMFELERPLGPAQTTMLEWKLKFPPDYPPNAETGHGVARRARELVLWTRFHPDALPDWIEEVEETPTETVVTPLFLNGATTIHQVRQGWGPGMLVLRWGYGERG